MPDRPTQPLAPVDFHHVPGRPTALTLGAAGVAVMWAICITVVVVDRREGDTMLYLGLIVATVITNGLVCWACTAIGLHRTGRALHLQQVQIHTLSASMAQVVVWLQQISAKLDARDWQEYSDSLAHFQDDRFDDVSARVVSIGRARVGR